MSMIRSSDPARPPRWVIATGLGLVLGALVLGGGGRAAMRGISLIEHRALQWTVGGTLRVVAFGAGFGVAAGLLRAALATWVGPHLRPRQEAAAFIALGTCLGVVGLTPLTANRLALFLPVVTAFLVAFEHLWRRAMGPIGNQSHDAKAGAPAPHAGA